MAMMRRLLADELPTVVPVFAISGAILLPGGTMPLVAFEPRYLSLVDHALGAGRLFGLVQPRVEGDGSELFDVGCLARITAFGETGDGRYLITVAGICRFRVTAEIEGQEGYRRAEVDYKPFRADLDSAADTAPVDRRPLIAIMRSYLGGMGMAADLAALEKSSDAELAIRLSMACPFSPAEKQALLEAPNHAERCRLMTAMIQRELLAESGSSSIH
jgi:uncharacterized protein